MMIDPNTAINSLVSGIDGMNPSANYFASISVWQKLMKVQNESMLTNIIKIISKIFCPNSYINKSKITKLIIKISDIPGLKFVSN